MSEQEIETSLVNKLKDLKHRYRPELNNRSALENNFRAKFEELNRVKLTDGEFARLLDEVQDASKYQCLHAR
jgi:type I restriction enzyme R subunit